MIRPLLAIALGLAVTACVPRYTRVDSGDTSQFGVVSLGGSVTYLIDPRTETCILLKDGMESAWSVRVSCAKLKANVPGAVQFITWDTSKEAPLAP